MQRVEEIKEKRQAQFIRDRQKKAKLIEREKDAREVKRDMALIRSPAAGMKRVAKEMEVDENEVFVHYFIQGLRQAYVFHMRSLVFCGKVLVHEATSVVKLLQPCGHRQQPMQV